MLESLDARAKTVFDDAIELPSDERSAHLDRACTDDPELRKRVEAILLGAEKADLFLSDPAMGPDGRHTAHSWGEQPGTHIGPYKILELIGEGGFGSVFMAEQSVPVRRRVALKVIKLGMDSRAVVARFEQERQALAMMDHAHIARVLDAGTTELGRPYFVMELVKGEPITVYCDAENLTIPARLVLFTQVCRAVQHAHTKGIIHRDIKPTNVLVSTQDGRPFSKVIDFGIAKATERRLIDKTVFTEFHQLIGTLEYMSPEQAAGGLDIDTRTDVYSLGVLLYELLAGVTPLDPRRLSAASFEEMQRIIREVDPPKPSTRLSKSLGELASVAARRQTDPRKLGSIVRGELDWIAMRALDKDRARRYESPGNLAADIERFLAGEPVLAVPPSMVYRATKLFRRHRLGFTAAGFVALALLFGLGATLWQARIAARDRDLARRSAAEALAAKEVAEARSKETEIIAAFQSAQLNGIDVESMGARLIDDLLADSKAGWERIGLPAVEIGRRQAQLANLLADANPTNVALSVLDKNIFSRALKAVGEQFEDQPLIKARLLQTLADTLTELGLFDKAMAPQSEALAIRRRILGNDDPATLISMNNMGARLHYQGRFSEAEVLAREALQTRSRVSGEDHPETLSSINNLGMALLLQGKRNEAEACFQGLLDSYRRVLGSDNPDTLQAMNNMGGLLVDGDKPAEAEPFFREALERKRRVLGDDDPDTLLSMNNLALVLEKLDRRADAEPLYREALERSRRTRGEDHADTLLFMSNLGFLLYKMDKLEEAASLTREALDRRQRVFGGEHGDTLQSVSNMGVVLMARGKLDEAEGYLRAAVEGYAAREARSSASRGPHHADTARARCDLGRVLCDLGRFADAETSLLTAETSLRNGQMENSPDHKRCTDALVRLYDMWGKADPGHGHAGKADQWRTR